MSNKYPYPFIPLMIMTTEKVEELLESHEAKSYLKEVKSGSIKLQRLFDRECVGNAILGPKDQQTHIQKLENFLDKNVPTWRSEIDELQTDNRST